jgi:hypothetical protein
METIIERFGAVTTYTECITAMRDPALLQICTEIIEQMVPSTPSRRRILMLAIVIHRHPTYLIPEEPPEPFHALCEAATQTVQAIHPVPCKTTFAAAFDTFFTLFSHWKANDLTQLRSTLQHSHDHLHHNLQTNVAVQQDDEIRTWHEQECQQLQSLANTLNFALTSQQEDTSSSLANTLNFALTSQQEDTSSSLAPAPEEETSPSLAPVPEEEDTSSSSPAPAPAPAPPSSNTNLESLTSAVDTQVRRAFWDVLKTELRESTSTHLEVLLTEVRDRINALTPRRHDWHIETNTALDSAYIGQMVRHQCMDAESVNALVVFVTDRLLALGAPNDDERVRDWSSQLRARLDSGADTLAEILPSFFEFVHTRLDAIEAATRECREQMAASRRTDTR